MAAKIYRPCDRCGGEAGYFGGVAKGDFPRRPHNASGTKTGCGTSIAWAATTSGTWRTKAQAIYEAANDLMAANPKMPIRMAISLATGAATERAIRDIELVYGGPQ